jgi:hypothetical protein
MEIVSHNDFRWFFARTEKNAGGFHAPYTNGKRKERCLVRFLPVRMERITGQHRQTSHRTGRGRQRSHFIEQRTGPEA